MFILKKKVYITDMSVCKVFAILHYNVFYISGRPWDTADI